MKKKDQTMPLTTKKKKVYKLKKPKPNKTEVLNLNSEVVRMRKEVKRVRALIIRKLNRQISSLKKRKGKEEDLERNKRRVGRLLEEIHELKVLKPDTVTKAALQKDLSFELVCKNLSSPLSERATARIATHPQFRKKINAIKDAIKAFKDERIKEAVDKKGTNKVNTEETLKTVTCQLANSVGVVGEEEEEIRDDGGDLEPKKQERKEKEDSDVEESDLEVSEEEKEYFDDSTEERFRKQSSQSEESDDDDFFVGKVSKYKKKKSNTAPHKEEEKRNDLNNPKDPLEQSDQPHGELDEHESRMSSKAPKMTSVFCSSLAGSGSGFREGGQSRGFRGRGRARGRGQDRGRGGQRGGGPDRVFSEPPRFQKFVERGKGQSRGNVAKHQDTRQAPEQALHPSWEASKKRKEQQGQILAFQGKKIKFDD
ncbi:serum response factor-binding protein 1 [Aplochiton taeniatus]